MTPIVEVVEKWVTNTMNEMLLKDFTIDKVGVALNQMSSLKAPGLDGFSTGFYQKIWGMWELKLVGL